MTHVSFLVQKLVEDTFGPNELHRGLECLHKDGRRVKITSGRYWGAHGVSNFWYWREVMPDGTLSDDEEHGYGHQLRPYPTTN